MEQFEDEVRARFRPVLAVSVDRGVELACAKNGLTFVDLLRQFSSRIFTEERQGLLCFFRLQTAFIFYVSDQGRKAPRKFLRAMFTLARIALIFGLEMENDDVIALPVWYTGARRPMRLTYF